MVCEFDPAKISENQYKLTAKAEDDVLVLLSGKYAAFV